MVHEKWSLHQREDSNPQPLGRESFDLTTRPNSSRMFDEYKPNNKKENLFEDIKQNV